jgi:hypothetical protein
MLVGKLGLFRSLAFCPVKRALPDEQFDCGSECLVSCA